MSSAKAEILRDQYRIMIRRLWYIITWPSAILTLFLGLWLLIDNPLHLEFNYMWVKLGMVLLLYIYQVYGEKIVRDIKSNKPVPASFTFRLLNEVPTVILIAVVFLIVLKNAVSWVWGVLGIVGIAVLLAIAAKIYKRFRTRE